MSPPSLPRHRPLPQTDRAQPSKATPPRRGTTPPTPSSPDQKVKVIHPGRTRRATSARGGGLSIDTSKEVNGARRRCRHRPKEWVKLSPWPLNPLHDRGQPVSTAAAFPVEPVDCLPQATGSKRRTPSLSLSPNCERLVLDWCTEKIRIAQILSDRNIESCGNTLEAEIKGVFGCSNEKHVWLVVSADAMTL